MNYGYLQATNLAAGILVQPLQESVNAASTIFVKLLDCHCTAEYSDSIIMNY
jgi:hypothetical protein